MNPQECICTCPSGWRGMDCSGTLYEIGSTTGITVDNLIIIIIIKGMVCLSGKKTNYLQWKF